MRDPDVHVTGHGPEPATDQNHMTVAMCPDNPEACITLCVKPSHKHTPDYQYHYYRCCMGLVGGSSWVSVER